MSNRQTGTEPSWILDLAETLMASRNNALLDAMLREGENVTDKRLLRERCRQLDKLLNGGLVLAVDHGSWKSGARFADFYSVQYDDIGSGARALTVVTDEPMAIRPQGDRKVIITRA